MEVVSKSNLRKRNNKLLIPAVGIALISLLLMSGCGNKENSKQATNPSNPNPTPAAPMGSSGCFEDPIPGNSLLFANNSQQAFKTMLANLSGTATLTVSDQKSFDYTVAPTSLGGSPNLSRQEGRNLNLAAATLKAQAGTNSVLGKLSITIFAPQNNTELSRTFIFQYQINISGVVLNSTDQVAIFKAINPTPFATDFLKVNYTTKNPSIQRFRINQLSPFPVSGINPQVWGTNTRTSWINVISQKLTSVFQYPGN